MPEYMFYPSTCSGGSPGFEAHELPNEAVAMLRAEVVLAEHQSCSSVAVWQTDRLVMLIYRSVLGHRVRSWMTPEPQLAQAYA